MEQIWKWNQLSINEKLHFGSFIIETIIEKFNSSINSLILLCLFRFLKASNLIATIFHNNLTFFELRLIEQIKHIRLQLKDDLNIEYVCFCYDFAPKEIQKFIDQIRKQHATPSSMNQCIHFIRCDNKNIDHYKWFIEHGGQDLEIRIIHLDYSNDCFPFYSEKQFIQSYLRSHVVIEKLDKWKDFFKYDIRYVPQYPNELFLNQLFNSIDDICLHGKIYLQLLLNHLENIKEKTIGIKAKMMIYKLTNEIYEFKQDQNEFFNFLIDKALKKEPNFIALKKWILENATNQSALKSIYYLI